MGRPEGLLSAVPAPALHGGLTRLERSRSAESAAAARAAGRAAVSGRPPTGRPFALVLNSFLVPVLRSRHGCCVCPPLQHGAFRGQTDRTGDFHGIPTDARRGRTRYGGV